MVMFFKVTVANDHRMVNKWWGLSTMTRAEGRYRREFSVGDALRARKNDGCKYGGSITGVEEA